MKRTLATAGRIAGSASVEAARRTARMAAALLIVSILVVAFLALTSAFDASTPMP